MENNSTSWHVGIKPGPIVYGPQGEQIADCRSISFTNEENKQHARLIAAAPELLEALKGLLENAPAHKGIKKDFSYILYLEAARTAITKAEG